jgi:outer membrane protein OmpA-like peptidoglycan-associated protein
MQGIKRFSFLAVSAAVVCSLFAQTPSGAPVPPPEAPRPVYRAEVVSRTVRAVSYRNRSGWTRLDFKGTSLAPEAKGKIEVNSRKGYIQVKASIRHLPPVTKFGGGYLTYMLWAITPNGNPKSLGEFLVNGDGDASLNVTTNLQAFGLIATAEPYFAISQPSDVVVAENVVREDTLGKSEAVEASYDLLPRDSYPALPSHPSSPKAAEKDVPLELYEARNAVAVARGAGAEQYSGKTFETAASLLAQAEKYQERRAGRKPVTMTARESVQWAEDARLVAVREAREAALRKERDDAAAREADALGRESAAVAEANALRGQLRAQLNVIAETRDTTRGLIVNLSGVLFDTGKFDLRTAAREKLAKISGIVEAHPGLILRVEGHTDSTGGDDLNQKLSERRAGSVRDYLISQGVSPNAVSAAGFGKSGPVASNNTAGGRQLNRRVEIVVSGSIIGSTSSVRRSDAPAPPK